MSIFVLVVGLGMIGVGAYSYVAESASLDNRVAVTGEITDTSVERVPGSRGREVYVPTVTFQYRFEGAEYTSDRLYPGTAQPRYEDRSTAESRLSTYAVGERVTAYVDPDAPGQAFLTAARSGQALGAVVVGFVVSLIGGVGLFQARRESRARKREF
jgi:hypothetical protein